MLERQGEAARQRFIRANLRLVGMVCQQFAGRGGVSEADLFQEGCVGLIVAVERFDHARGYRFSTYALFWIRAYIGAATARQLGAMNLPTSRAERLRAARGVEAELAQLLGRSPPWPRWPRRSAGRRAGRPTCSPINAPLPSTSSTVRSWMTVRSVEAFDAVVDDQFSVRDLLGHLDDLARRVLELRLGFADGEPRSFADTARVLHLSVDQGPPGRAAGAGIAARHLSAAGVGAAVSVAFSDAGGEQWPDGPNRSDPLSRGGRGPAACRLRPTRRGSHR